MLTTAPIMKKVCLWTRRTLHSLEEAYSSGASDLFCLMLVTLHDLGTLYGHYSQSLGYLRSFGIFSLYLLNSGIAPPAVLDGDPHDETHLDNER